MGSTSAGLLGLQGADERVHPSFGQGEQRGVDQRLLPWVGFDRYGTRKCSFTNTALLLLWDVLIPDHGLSLCSLSASLPSLLVGPNSVVHLFHQSRAHCVLTSTNFAEEGARVPLNIALKDIGGTTGKYWANSSVSGTGEGQVQKW
jgi:hypothetical protein